MACYSSMHQLRLQARTFTQKKRFLSVVGQASALPCARESGRRRRWLYNENTMLCSMRYRFFTENNAPTSSEIILAVCTEHLSVIDALLETDSEKAFQQMLNHTNQSYSRILHQLSDLGDNSLPNQ